MATTWAINSYLKHYVTIPSFSKAECKNKTKQKTNFRKVVLTFRLCYYYY